MTITITNLVRSYIDHRYLILCIDLHDINLPLEHLIKHNFRGFISSTVVPNIDQLSVSLDRHNGKAMIQ